MKNLFFLLALLPLSLQAQDWAGLYRCSIEQAISDDATYKAELRFNIPQEGLSTLQVLGNQYVKEEWTIELRTSQSSSRVVAKYVDGNDYGLFEKDEIVLTLRKEDGKLKSEFSQALLDALPKLKAEEDRFDRINAPTEPDLPHSTAQVEPEEEIRHQTDDAPEPTPSASHSPQYRRIKKLLPGFWQAENSPESYEFSAKQTGVRGYMRLDWSLEEKIAGLVYVNIELESGESESYLVRRLDQNIMVLSIRHGNEWIDVSYQRD